MPHSIVSLTVSDASVQARIELPLDDLTLAMGEDPTQGADEHDAAATTTLKEYLAEHVSILTPDGQVRDAHFDEISVSEAEQTSTGEYREVTASATFTAPLGASTRAFTLDDDAIIHQVVTHKILVEARADWSGGSVAGVEDEKAFEQLGIIKVDTGTGEVAPLDIDLGEGSLAAGFGAMFGLSMDHILEGTDHLMFLLVLLLPAPLIASAHRWARPAPLKSTAKRILVITLSFTLGHSLTLAISALAHFSILAQPVDALIALSILVGAVHALRPVFPGREGWIAAIFGLIHGMAFSFTLAEFDLSTGQLVLSLLGFNLGIEAMQLLVVALVLPDLTISSRTQGYRPLRVIGASVIAIAAVGWILDRLGVANTIATLADGIATYQVWILAALWLYAIGCWCWHWYSRRVESSW